MQRLHREVTAEPSGSLVADFVLATVLAILILLAIFGKFSLIEEIQKENAQISSQFLSEKGR